MSTQESCTEVDVVAPEPEAVQETGTLLPPLDPDLKAERVQEDATDPVPAPADQAG
jgi:hypothetical protein